MKNPTEHAEQAAVVEWCRRHSLLVMAVPNGANCGPRERARLSTEGLEKGAPDIQIRTPPPWAPEVKVVALEMKRRSGGRLSEAQVAWIASVADMPWWRVIVAEGARDAVLQLMALGYGQGSNK